MAAVARRDLIIGQLIPGKDGGPLFKVSNGHCERLDRRSHSATKRARIVLRGPTPRLCKENEDAVQIEFTIPALRVRLYKSLKRDVGWNFVGRIERGRH